MVGLRSLMAIAASISLVYGGDCPFGHTSAAHDSPQTLEKRDAAQTSHEFLNQFVINDTDVYLTSDVGGPIEDQNSLKAGERGPTLLEDFIFRQKITHFDHERVSPHSTPFLHTIEQKTRYQNEPFTLEAQVPMEFLSLTEIGPILRLLLFSAPKARRPLRSCASRQWLVVEVARIRPEMYMGLLLASTLMRVILVSSLTSVEKITTNKTAIRYCG
jgi:hypothetical protein